jgi:glutathione-specific gamma-glutamylcyclotransferase
MKDICCMVYIGMPDNPQFLGPLDPEEVAKTINNSIGPSGQNRDYLLQLEASLLSLSPASGDGHVTDLARRVRTMTPPQKEPELAGQALPNLQTTSITDEHEEVEKPN